MWKIEKKDSFLKMPVYNIDGENDNRIIGQDGEAKSSSTGNNSIRRGSQLDVLDSMRVWCEAEVGICDDKKIKAFFYFPISRPLFPFTNNVSFICCVLHFSHKLLKLFSDYKS